MTVASESLVERVNRLGIECSEVPLDQLSSAIAALACFPMYMVANLHAWTENTQFRIPVADIPGFEAIREAFCIGRQESRLQIDAAHRKSLGTLLRHPKPADLVIYEYALETLELFLAEAEQALAEDLRTAVARMIVAVAKSSGEGLFGTGEKVNRQEFLTIQRIVESLDLRQSQEATELLTKLD